MSEARIADGLPLTARRKALWPVLAVTAAFVISRIGYHAAGVRFDASSLPWLWQFIDPALLKANLWQSLWYLHSQPPMFNLFLGIVVNLFPGHESAVFAFSYLLLGLIFAVALFLLLRGFGVPDVLSAVAAAVYAASPAVVLYENWLFYAYPVTVLLLLVALFWQRFVRSDRFLDALLIFVCAALLALTWSLFHLVWLLALVIVLAYLRRKGWRKVLSAAAVPVLIVVFWYGKNLVQFGQFTGSTWFGMSFAKITVGELTTAERRVLYDSGTISAVSLLSPFSSPEEYYRTVPKQSTTGIPVLDQETKPSGFPNYNNVLYVTLSRRYGRDAFRTLMSRPASYARGLAESYFVYSLPSGRHRYLPAGNAARINALERRVNLALNGLFGLDVERNPTSVRLLSRFSEAMFHPGWLLIWVYALVLVFGPVFLLRRAHSVTYSTSLLFLWLNIAWITLAANAVEVGENSRFRFTADPLVFVFLLVVAVVLAKSLPRRSRVTPPCYRAGSQP